MSNTKAEKQCISSFCKRQNILKPETNLKSSVHAVYAASANCSFEESSSSLRFAVIVLSVQGTFTPTCNTRFLLLVETCTSPKTAAQSEQLIKLLVYRNTVALLLVTLKHCYTISLVVVNKAAVPIFESSEQCISTVLLI